MQLIQRKVQKWRTTTFPFRSASDTGLLLIQASMPWSAGAGIFISAGCWARAEDTPVSNNVRISVPTLGERIECMRSSPVTIHTEKRIYSALQKSNSSATHWMSGSVIAQVDSRE